MKSTTDRHGKPLEGWTLQQWEDFKKEADLDFNKYLVKYLRTTVNISLNNARTLWLSSEE